MKKLRLGKVVLQLDGTPYQKDGRDMVIKDLIVELYPTLGGQGKGPSLSISAAMHAIYACNEETIKLENHDHENLQKALEDSPALVWVKTELVKVFEEAEKG